MINKTLLKKTLLFEHEQPSFSKIRALNELIVRYEEEYSLTFLVHLGDKKQALLMKNIFLNLYQKSFLMEL